MPRKDAAFNAAWLKKDPNLVAEVNSGVVTITRPGDQLFSAEDIARIQELSDRNNDGPILQDDIIFPFLQALEGVTGNFTNDGKFESIGGQMAKNIDKVLSMLKDHENQMASLDMLIFHGLNSNHGIKFADYQLDIELQLNGTNLDKVRLTMNYSRQPKNIVPGSISKIL